MLFKNIQVIDTFIKLIYGKNSNNLPVIVFDIEINQLKVMGAVFIDVLTLS